MSCCQERIWNRKSESITGASHTENTCWHNALPSSVLVRASLPSTMGNKRELESASTQWNNLMAGQKAPYRSSQAGLVNGIHRQACRVP